MEKIYKNNEKIKQALSYFSGQVDYLSCELELNEEFNIEITLRIYRDLLKLADTFDHIFARTDEHRGLHHDNIEKIFII